jgi:uncharacterized protein with HEPN domain
MQRADHIRLRHMLDAAREATGYVAGKTRADLHGDRMLEHSLVRCIEILGEAAAKVSDETRAACPALPWPAIVGMRNRLIHAYFDVDLDRVWDTVVDDLPPLVAALEAALADPP